MTAVMALMNTTFDTLKKSLIDEGVAQ